MKYKERDELVSSLRELADFVEKKGLDLPFLSVTATAHITDYDQNFATVEGKAKRLMANAARALAPCTKDYSTYYLQLTKKFGDVKVEVTTYRDKVCKKVPTGEVKLVAETKYVETGNMIQEEQFEWVCDEPLLAN